MPKLKGNFGKKANISSKRQTNLKRFPMLVHFQAQLRPRQLIWENISGEEFEAMKMPFKMSPNLIGKYWLLGQKFNKISGDMNPKEYCSLKTQL
jgi:hypothetical protein